MYLKSKHAIFSVLGLSSLILSSGCGVERRQGAPSIEEAKIWEGIDRAGSPTETASMSAILSSKGVPTDSSKQVVTTGNLQWKLISIDDITRGVARTWSSVEERWVAARVMISYVRDSNDSTASLDTQTLILRESLVMVDNEGNRHLPLNLHERIAPRIDLPLEINAPSMTFAVLFPIRRDLKPAALEIHHPLGDGRISWYEAAEPSDWIVWNTRMIFEDKSLRALWDVTLRRVRLIETGSSATDSAASLSAGSGSSGGPEFVAELTLRNVTPSVVLAPDPSAARLYAGEGRTLASVSLPQSVAVAPGKSTSLLLRFVNVPRRQSLEVVLPYHDDIIRMDALPGFFRENISPMNEPVLSGGIQAAVYSVKRAGGFRIRVGLKNNNPVSISSAALKIIGMYQLDAHGIADLPVQGVMRDAPEMLHPGFEERRWIEFPREVSAIRFELPGKLPILVKI